MKMIKKISILFTLLYCMLTVVGCKEDNDNYGIPYEAYSPATVVDRGDGDYLFVLDAGARVTFEENVFKQELKDVKRIWLHYYFYEKDLQTIDGIDHIKGKLIEAYEINVADILSLEKAKEQNLLEKDSIYSINNVTMFGGNGFLTLMVNTPYVQKHAPTLNVYCDPEEQNGDTLALRLVVNRHSTSSITGNINLLKSFGLMPYASRFGGRDSLVISIREHADEKSKAISAKIGFKDMIDMFAN